MKAQQTVNVTGSKTGPEEWLETVRRQVESLRFGVVQIVVHDSQIVQIERTERVRFERKNAEGQG
jgi:hypothetical protein